MTEQAELVRAVDEADEGPEIAAVFDFDGTLLAGYSATLLTAARLRRGELSPLKLLRSTVGSMGAMRDRDMNRIIAVAAELMAGQHHSRLLDAAESDFASVIAPRLHSEARALVEAHRRRGHTLIIASSATSYQVEPAGRALDVDHILCTQVEVDAEGLATGRLDGVALWGDEKANAVAALADKLDIDLSRSFAYSDGSEDVPLLQLVGHPRAINPGSRLSRTAKREGWKTLRFTSRDRATPLDVARSGLAAGALWPVLSAAAGIGLARRDSHSAAQLVASLWPDMALSLGGISLDVSGQRHLHTDGPAIVAFNHRTLVDELVIARLLRRDFVMVLHDQHLAERVVTSIGRPLGVVVSDGDGIDPARSVSEALESGNTVAVALPEHPPGSVDIAGTGGRVLRMAADGGVPVVPVVIHNADDLQRRAGIVRAGRITVEVKDPIPVDILRSDPKAARSALDQAVQP